MGSTGSTVAELVQARWEDHRTGLRWADGALSHHEVTAGAAARAALLADLLSSRGEPHIGVLLDNTPEYSLWLSAAALAGVAVAGITPPGAAPNWPVTSCTPTVGCSSPNRFGCRCSTASNCPAYAYW